MGGPVLIIRHQTRGCHTWGLAGGTYKASQSLTLTKGEHLMIGNNDVMPHRIVQLAGPALKLGVAANLNSVGKTVELILRARGRVPLHHQTRRGLHERDQDDRRGQRAEAEGDRARVGRALAAPLWQTASTLFRPGRGRTRRSSPRGRRPARRAGRCRGSRRPSPRGGTRRPSRCPARRRRDARAPSRAARRGRARTTVRRRRRESAPLRRVGRDLDADDRRDRLVEPSRRGEVGDPDPKVVDEVVAGARLSRVDRLGAVAVRVEQEGAVVAGGVLRPLARFAVALVAGVDTRLPEGIHVVAGPSDERDVKMARRRPLGTCLRDAEVVPFVEMLARVRDVVAEDAEERFVELPTRAAVGHADPHVVPHREDSCNRRRRVRCGRRG